MSQWLKVASGAVYALVVAGALTVGARTAFAQSVAMDCPYDPPHWLGACGGSADCQYKCVAAGGVEGQCLNGCCRCLL